MKYIDIEEFLEEGYLQEVNRLFLHPLGLALEVTVEDDGSHSISGVWDCRDDPEGVAFASVDADKADRVARIHESRKVAREEHLGYWIQPKD